MATITIESRIVAHPSGQRVEYRVRTSAHTGTRIGAWADSVVAAHGRLHLARTGHTVTPVRAPEGYSGRVPAPAVRTDAHMSARRARKAARRQGTARAISWTKAE